MAASVPARHGAGPGVCFSKTSVLAKSFPGDGLAARFSPRRGRSATNPHPVLNVPELSLPAAAGAVMVFLAGAKTIAHAVAVAALAVRLSQCWLLMTAKRMRGLLALAAKRATIQPAVLLTGRLQRATVRTQLVMQEEPGELQLAGISIFRAATAAIPPALLPEALILIVGVPGTVEPAIGEVLHGVAKGLHQTTGLHLVWAAEVTSELRLTTATMGLTVLSTLRSSADENLCPD